MTRLFVTDLDQTFLHEDKTFDAERFAKILDQLDENGDQFAIATGREAKWVRSKFGVLADRVHLVTNNGAAWHVRGTAETDLRTLDASTLAELERILVDVSPKDGIIAFSEDNMYRLSGYGELRPDLQDYMTHVYGTIHLVDHLTDIPQPLASVTAIFDVPSSNEAIRRINASGMPLHPTTSGYGAVGILAEGVNKATSLSALINKLSLAPEQLTVFGDGMNDLEMMELAGQVYVMPNADERLFNRGFGMADLDNEHDGVLAKLEEII